MHQHNGNTETDLSWVDGVADQSLQYFPSGHYEKTHEGATTKACMVMLVMLVLATVVPTTLAAEIPPSQSSQRVVPPALQVLEQKMLRIRFNTARISVRFVLGELGAPASGTELGANVNGCKNLVSSAAGTFSISPPASMTIEKRDGVVTSKQRSIGRTIYTYTPSAEGYDDGRPWVRSVQKPTPQSTIDSELAVLSAALPAAHPASSAGLFKDLVEEVDGALSIKELGPTTIDGQRVTGYTATVSMAKLLAQRRIVATNKLANETTGLELFVASNGMPVRTTSIIGTRSEGIGVEDDILAVGIPVAVHAPPARRTIGQARLHKLEEQRAKKRMLHLGEPMLLHEPLNSVLSKCS